MSSEALLEAGKIANTHGIRGELKVIPWCDSAEFLCQFDRFCVNEREYQVRSARVHKGNALILLEGIDSIDAAEGFKNQILYFYAEDVELDEGQHFISDLIGLEVFDHRTNAVIGKLEDVISNPEQDLMVVKGNSRQEILIPWVDAFVKEISPETGTIHVDLIEGLIPDEN